MLEAGSVARVPEIPQLEWLSPNLGLTKDLGARQKLLGFLQTTQ